MPNGGVPTSNFWELAGIQAPKPGESKGLMYIKSRHGELFAVQGAGWCLAPPCVHLWGYTNPKFSGGGAFLPDPAWFRGTYGYHSNQLDETVPMEPVSTLNPKPLTLYPHTPLAHQVGLGAQGARAGPRV